MNLCLLTIALLAACVTIQSIGTVVMIGLLERDRNAVAYSSAIRAIGVLLRLFLAIVVIHMIQIGFWAIVFWRARELPNLETAVYFSAATFTTIGFGDVILGPGWRVMAGVEGLTGMILVGWSTAFVFAVVNHMYQDQRRTLKRRDRAARST